MCLSSNPTRDEMLLKVGKSDLQNMSDLKTEFITNNQPCASKKKKEQGLTADRSDKMERISIEMWEREYMLEKQ